MKDSEALLIYFRYLRGRIDAITSLPHLGMQEIGPLQGELRVFRERVPGMSFLPASMKELFFSIKLEIPSCHLEGTSEHFRSTWWYYLPLVRYWRAERQQKDRDIIEAKLSALRDSLYDLYRLAEVSFEKPNPASQPTPVNRRG
jgi:hypothetical protein